MLRKVVEQLSNDMRQKEVRERLEIETYNEVLNKVKETGKCVIIRPTGFGKTHLLARLTNRFTSTLYLYPTDIIKIDLKNKYKAMIKNTTFMSYRKLLLMYQEDKDVLEEILVKYQLILMDEVHIAGAEKTSKVIKELVSLSRNNYFIGATATPDRTDSFNVVEEFFDGHVISEYNLHNAIEDGLLSKPYYVYSVYKEVKLNNLIEGISERRNKDKINIIEKELKAVEIEVSKLVNASNVIRESINRVYNNEKQDYMKFVVFFSEKELLNIKKGDVMKWFSEAYPNMKINNLIITSDSIYAKNINRLNSLKYKKNTIDLIYCIDMLNMGYHIADLTGIVMLRGTSSNIIYKQQIGRCLSAVSNKTPIIFDFVNNILRKPYFHRGNEEETNKRDKQTGRLNDLTYRDLIIDDKTANLRKIIDKLVYEVNRLKLEDAIYYYTKRSMPMRVVVRETGLSEVVLREQFNRLGIKVED